MGFSEEVCALEFLDLYRLELQSLAHVGLAMVLVFVFFFVQRRNEEVEDEMITKVKDRMKLTGSDSSSKPPWEQDL